MSTLARRRHPLARPLVAVLGSLAAGIPTASALSPEALAALARPGGVAAVGEIPAPVGPLRLLRPLPALTMPVAVVARDDGVGPVGLLLVAALLGAFVVIRLTDGGAVPHRLDRPRTRPVHLSPSEQPTTRRRHATVTVEPAPARLTPATTKGG